MTDEGYMSFERWPGSIGQQLLPHIKDKIIHATNPQGFKGILTTGSILPNDGTLPYSHHQSPNYFGGHNKWICVFDFAQASEDEIIHVHEDWKLFLYDSKHPKFLLDINRGAIVDHLVPNIVARNQKNSNRGFIHYVEAWIKEPIPLSAINSCIVTRYIPDTEKLEICILDTKRSKDSSNP